MVCKLCDQEKSLVKSHIIPNFLYEGMFDENHQLAYTTFPEFSNKSKRPTGVYDKTILCSNCDNNVIGKFETYGRHVIKNGRGLIFKKENIGLGAEALVVENINYIKFKLFLLSILFKASISNHEFFSSVEISNNDLIRLKQMLMEGDGGEESEFPVLILKIRLRIPEFTKGIMQPVKLNFEKKNGGFVFLINGFFYWFSPSVQFQNQIFNKAIIKKSNRVIIPIIGGTLGESLFKKFTKLPYP